MTPPARFFAKDLWAIFRAIYPSALARYGWARDGSDRETSDVKMEEDSRRRSGQGERFQCAGCSSPSFGPLGVLIISTRRRNYVAGGLAPSIFLFLSTRLLRLFPQNLLPPPDHAL